MGVDYLTREREEERGRMERFCFRERDIEGVMAMIERKKQLCYHKISFILK